MSKKKEVEVVEVEAVEVLDVANYALAEGAKKNDVITDLILNYKLDLAKAEEWWKSNGAKKGVVGFLAGFDSKLVEGNMSDKEVEAYVKENGSANTLRHLSSYLARAKLAEAVRAKILEE